jgi:hypothetical protein
VSPPKGLPREIVMKIINDKNIYYVVPLIKLTSRLTRRFGVNKENDSKCHNSWLAKYY